MKKRVYLAYGSNLDITQMAERCPTATILGIGKIQDYELVFKGSLTGAYLTIEPKEGKYVPVGAWEVTPEDEEKLDAYEGYPRFYYKKDMVLPLTNYKTGKTRRRRAFAYVMPDGRRLGIPTRRYLSTCANGYDAFGFDLELLKEAFVISQGG